MDFVFGKLVNDDLKVTHHRADLRGIQHGYVIDPPIPKPDQPVTLKATTDSTVQVTQMALVYTTDGSPPVGSRGGASNGQVIRFERTHISWDTLMWGYIAHWQAVIPAQPENTVVHYVISGWTDDGAEVYGDWPDVKETVEYATQVFFNGLPARPDHKPGDPSVGTVFAYSVDTLTPPAWARHALIYHLMVDRFYHGDGDSWLQTDNLTGFCGGTLWGVRDKLEYLVQLGIDCLWLSPTWVSPTSHGYDVSDYDRVEPRLGGDEALRAVVEGAHDRGMRVILDMACNHISNEHPYFQEALHDPHSPYRDWFYFDDSAIGYRCFFGTSTMPDLNLKHPAARNWMIGVATHWLQEFDIDGYRLDYANGPGPQFWTAFRLACKRVKPDCLLFGEVIDSPDKLLRYAGRLDGCLNFQVNDALRRRFGWKSWTPQQLDLFIEEHYRYFPDDFVMPTFLDNHDMDRFAFISQNDEVALRQAAEVQMRLPDPAIVYYGTEVGLRQMVSTRGHTLDINRVPMVWGDAQDAELLNFYKGLIRARRESHSRG